MPARMNKRGSRRAALWKFEELANPDFPESTNHGYGATGPTRQMPIPAAAHGLKETRCTPCTCGRHTLQNIYRHLAPGSGFRPRHRTAARAWRPPECYGAGRLRCTPGTWRRCCCHNAQTGKRGAAEVATNCYQINSCLRTTHLPKVVFLLNFYCSAP